MGINAELFQLLATLRSANNLYGDSLIELGAQDVCVTPENIRRVAAKFDVKHPGFDVSNAKHFYELFGFSNYSCIDANGGNGALLFDLNKDIQEHYGFYEKYHLVTNLGTSEHCFNQLSVFKNAHDLCKNGGLMVHALPTQGNVNHGFYNYHPRFFIDLSIANDYEVLDLSFTVDYESRPIKYSIEEYKKWDSHDLLFYAVLRKRNADQFKTPFDGMFVKQNKIEGYGGGDINPLGTEFSPYLKKGDWDNTKGYEQKSLSMVSRLMFFLNYRIFKK